MHEIIRDVACRYAGERKEMDHGVHQFVAELEQEGLIVTDESHVNSGEPGAAIQGTTQAIEGHPVFETPALQNTVICRIYYCWIRYMRLMMKSLI